MIFEKPNDSIGEQRETAHAYHVRELYRVIRLIESALREGDHETALALAEMTETQPAAMPTQLSEKEFEQAFDCAGA